MNDEKIWKNNYSCLIEIRPICILLGKLPFRIFQGNVLCSSLRRGRPVTAVIYICYVQNKGRLLTYLLKAIG